jgi:hypothetical protein
MSWRLPYPIHPCANWSGTCLITRDTTRNDARDCDINDYFWFRCDCEKAAKGRENDDDETLVGNEKQRRAERDGTGRLVSIGEYPTPHMNRQVRKKKKNVRLMTERFFFWDSTLQIAAMFISSATGLVIDRSVGSYQGFGLLVVGMTGIAGGIGSIQ